MNCHRVLLVCLFLGILLLICSTVPLNAIPLSGNYTVGGAAPSYSTLTDALNAAQTQGLAGTTTFHLRPGTYNGPFQLNLPGNAHSLVIRSETGSGVTLANPDASSSQNYVFYVNNTPKLYFQDL